MLEFGKGISDVAYKQAISGGLNCKNAQKRTDLPVC